MKRCLFLTFGALALSILAAGCAELDQFDAGLQESVDQLRAEAETSDKPLTDSSKVDLEAAGKSSRYTDQLADADQHLEQALQSKDYRDLDEAIDERPNDATYRLYRAALLWAEQKPVPAPVEGIPYRTIQADDEAFRDAARAKGLVLATGQSLESYYTLMLDTLLSTMAKYQEGSDQSNRLKFRYCATVGAYERELGRSASSLFYAGLMDGCGTLLRP